MNDEPNDSVAPEIALAYARASFVQKVGLPAYAGKPQDIQVVCHDFAIMAETLSIDFLELAICGAISDAESILKRAFSRSEYASTHYPLGFQYDAGLCDEHGDAPVDLETNEITKPAGIRIRVQFFAKKT